MVFKKEDERLIDQKGIVREEAMRQLDRFERGFSEIQLLRPCTNRDGIVILSEERKKVLEEKFNMYGGSVAKFVPASGAATRMFKDLFACLEHLREDPSMVQNIQNFKGGAVSYFFNNIQSFAFYKTLKKAFEVKHKISLEEALTDRMYVEVLEVLLTKGGLNYGNCPKGLLEFHSYDENNRTAAQEQLIEAKMHAPIKGKLQIHFTVSEGHEDAFIQNLKEDPAIDISYSVQNPSTDTVAVDLDNNLFRDKMGNLVFRPSGHGALLQNLNAVDSDLIFVKNIDNILPDRYKPETSKYKRILAGLLLEYQERTFDLLRSHDKNVKITPEARNLLEEMGITGIRDDKQCIEKLNRPLRVCGMVKNSGEPGGGPFWVRDFDEVSSVQIVEKSQVKKREDQKKIFKNATHFNPVDIVCGVKNYRGEKFDLSNYKNPETGFISEKTYEGKKIRAMELPGLWNGSMSDWNTIFVEVPLSTFGPVKKINDLLRTEHQPEREIVAD
ncbi:MAG: DUF4301 family protein [Cyclobacteriaceae bacterium]